MVRIVAPVAEACGSLRPGGLCLQLTALPPPLCGTDLQEMVTEGADLPVCILGMVGSNQDFC